ncbi:ATP-binding protein [Hyalangium versicolor]|uniref:ATP-binding protein n=1 Tax=Hyalangium versicolor TaxID=2861190 RepID=UPI001CCEC9E8|nr:BTAD domain-containing putative transcriptional regulator [Hyalangium versicolor]
MTGEWAARVLGLAHLEGPEGQRVRLERRAAVLLAYLGLEGPSPKFALASLLWPDSAPQTVRANMRQLLRRLRLAGPGEAWVDADSERLELGPSLAVDAARLKVAARNQEHARVLEALPAEGPGLLLAGFDFDDCPELARWVEGVRAAIDGWVRKAREAEIERYTSLGDWSAALALAQSWVQQEPESEQAGVHLIRLHYLRGDRGAALAAFERLRSMLSRELGVDPMPETLALVRQIEKGTDLPRPPVTARRPLPLSVLRPPLLAGREAAWRQLEEGWNAGLILFITGEPGAGKSRLAEEFASTRGPWGRIEARIGDRDVPFASAARAFRTQMARWPDAKLPDWVRTELSRILPELGDPRSLPPLRSEADTLRFYDAQAEAIRLLHQEECVSIADDVQYWDKASSKAFTYALTRMAEAGGAQSRTLRFIDCYRKGELPAYSQTYVHQLVDQGVARLIELGPLSAQEVHQMLAGLELPGAERHAEALSRYTGGNPLYVVETIKHFIETDSLHKPWPDRLPPPGRVGPLIRRRLEQLSPLALQSAQLAALAGSHFRASLVSEALQVSVSVAHSALAELEAAQVLMDERFIHDLVREAVQDSLQPASKRTLHGRLATVFENEGAPPLLLAHHWLEAGSMERALPYLLAAAQSQEQVLPLEQAADHYARAAVLLAEAGRTEEAAQARVAETRCRIRPARN